MNFEYNDEQKMVQSSASSLFENQFAQEARLYVEQHLFNQQIKKQLDNQGFLDVLAFSEDSDVSTIFASIVARESGRVLLPFPLVENMVANYYYNNIFNQSFTVPNQSIFTIGWGKQRLTTNTSKVGNVEITGTVSVVPFADDADYALISIPTNEENTQSTLAFISLKKDAVTKNKIASFDETYPVYDIELSNYTIMSNELIVLEQYDMYKDYKLLGKLLYAAELSGNVEEVLERTVEYTKERKQFDTVIAKYQAIKHMAADMHLQVSNMKVAVDYASWSLENKKEDFQESVLVAFTYAADAAASIVESGIQMHGGIGITWEHDLHLFLKRAQRISLMMGNAYSTRNELMKLIKASSSESVTV